MLCSSEMNNCSDNGHDRQLIAYDVLLSFRYCLVELCKFLFLFCQCDSGEELKQIEVLCDID